MPYDGIELDIEFGEFERNLRNELPERAFFGEFNYWPKHSRQTSNRFWFRLRYVHEDARDLLIPLITHDSQTEVILRAHP